MEQNFDSRSVLQGFYSFSESSRDANRRALIEKLLKTAKETNDGSLYWQSIYHAASQFGYDDEEEETRLIDALDIIVRSS